ncbi:hypothetical protein A2U01_0022101, partial [Trifolium medium]|nr:hypothetical protein [Trifolium medium]
SGCTELLTGFACLTPPLNPRQDSNLDHHVGTKRQSILHYGEI